MSHPPLPCYQVYAVRYAHKRERQRLENFIPPVVSSTQGDAHDGLMPMDYFVWAIVDPTGAHRTIVVDTGFDHAEGARRGRELLRLPSEGLALLDVDSRQVEDVIITHLHYDHAGTLDDFPNARFHLQDLEMAYATGRHMGHDRLRYAYTLEQVLAMVRQVYNGRVVFHDGDADLAPGVSVHHIGGHTMGLQCVRVHTQRGWLVLASDASHYYENMERAAPFPIAYSIGDMLEGYGKMRALAASERHVIPGHDPLVMQRYPAVNADLEGVAVRLDAEPLN